MNEIQNWQTFTFGAWNVRGLSKKKADVIAEIERENEDIVVLTETKLRGVGEEDHGNYVHLYSGVTYIGGTPCAGVSILIKKEHCRNICWKAVNERLIWAELCLCDKKVVVIGAYMVDECRSEEKKDAFISKLKEVILDIVCDSEVVILGDFNAHVGRAINNPVVGEYGVEQSNKNGNMLRRLCSDLNLRIQNTFFNHEDIHKYTWYGNGMKKSLVDYCITRQDSTFKVLDVLACRWLECGTDHIFLETTVAIPCFSIIQPSCSINSINNIPKYKSFLLFGKTYQAAYKKSLDSLVDIDISKTKSTTEVYEHLKEIVYAAADHVLGCVDENTFGQFLWDREIIEIRHLRHKQYTDKFSVPGLLDNNNNLDPKTKNEVWMGACEEINRKEKFKKYNVIRGILAEFLNVRDILNITNNKTLICNTCLSHDTLEKRFTETREIFAPTFNCNELVKFEPPIISINDIEMAFDDLEYNNHPSPGCFDVNLLKFCSTKTKIVLRHLVQSILNGSKIPEEIKCIYVYEESNFNTSSNSVTEVKVLHPILNIICSLVRKELESLQSFQRSCISSETFLNTVFMLRLLLQKNAAKQDALVHCAVIDLQGSYCSVLLEKMLIKLWDAGVSEWIIHLIRTLIIGNSIRIVKDCELSDPIILTKGLISSCSLAPLLFRFYISTELNSWFYEVAERGMKVGVNSLSFIFSNDKLIVFSKTKPGLEFMLRKLKEKFEVIGIYLTSEMINYLGDTDIKMGSELIPGQSEVNFHNWVLEKDGINEKDVDRRINEAKTVIGFLHPCARDETISDRVKRQIFNSIIKGVMTFGCETWTLTEPLKRAIDATELRYWKWCREEYLTGPSLRELMGVTQNMSEVMMLKKAAWYTRVKEMSKDLWVKRVLEWEPPGKRKAVRPKKKWVDGIEEFITSMGHLLKSDQLGRQVLENVLQGHMKPDVST